MANRNAAFSWAEMPTPTPDPLAAEVVPWEPEDRWYRPPTYESLNSGPQIVTVRPVSSPLPARYGPDRPAIRQAELRVGRVAYATRRENLSQPLPVYASPRYRAGAGNVVVTLTVVKNLAATAVMVTGALFVIALIVKLWLVMS